MTKLAKPVIHGRDHDCGGSDPLPSICKLKWHLEGGSYQSEQPDTFTTTWSGVAGDYEITNWPHITIHPDVWEDLVANGWGLWASWSAEAQGNIARIDVNPMNFNLEDLNDGDDPVTDAGWIVLGNSGILLDYGGFHPAGTDMDIFMRYQGGVVGGGGPTVSVRHGVLSVQWVAPGDALPSGSTYPSAVYPFMNTDIASNANITPTKLSHPGGTSQFLRADGTWATPSGGAPGGAAGGALDGIYPNPGLASSVAGNGLTETSDVLSVNTDGSTLEVFSDSLRVKAGGIADAQVASSAAIDPTKLSHPGGTTQFLRADGTWATTGGDPSTDTKVWMPLTTTVGGDDVLVFDADHSLIPTLITF